jgi:periplasmic divalent cation tolerance protein
MNNEIFINRIDDAFFRSVRWVTFDQVESPFVYRVSLSLSRCSYNSAMIVVLTTAPTTAEAEELAEKIVSAKLAACVQIVPKMTSIYVWEGKLQNEDEHLMLIKILPEKWEELRDFIIANHSYNVPEIVAINAEKVSEPYLKWMEEVLGEN